MNTNQLLDIMLDYAGEAGTIAAAEQHRAPAHVKADHSYVTDVDLRLSALAIERFTAVLPAERIITEENLEYLEAIQSTAPDADELLVVVDPIDGTRNYFHRMPLYGVSVGILRQRRPWLGVVVFPRLEEMMYCDGERAYHVERVFSPTPVKTVLETPATELSVNTTLLCSEGFASTYRWDFSRFQLLQTGCATVNLCWPTVGRGAGAFCGDHLWDLAGSWPILRALGFEFRGLHSGREVSAYDPADYDPQTHNLKEMLVVSRPDHFAAFAAAATVASD